VPIGITSITSLSEIPQVENISSPDIPVDASLPPTPEDTSKENIATPESPQISQEPNVVDDTDEKPSDPISLNPSDKVTSIADFTENTYIEKVQNAHEQPK
jgi:hypothetical protein